MSAIGERRPVASIDRRIRNLGSACSRGRGVGVLLAALLISVSANVAQAQAVLDTRRNQTELRHISLTLHKSRTLQFDRAIGQAHIGAVEIADVMPITDHTIYIQGKKIGTTNVSVFDDKNQLAAVVDLEVVPDTVTLQEKIKASTGGSGINVTSANGEVILSGNVNDAVGAARAVEVAKGFSTDANVVDAMKVAQSQQVMLKVRILEVDRNAGRDLGVNWNAASKNGVLASTGLGGLSIGSGASGQGLVGVSGTFPGAGAAATPFGALLANVVNTGGVSIDVLLSALETRGLVKSLAEPDLIALSGQKASFLAGGQIPIPTLNQGTAGSGATVSVQYQPYGVQLGFTPTVLANGVINLNLQPEVSEINDSAAPINVGGTSVPVLTDRKANTTVELRDGQSFAIAGLLQASSDEAVSQLPYLGTLPILGALFRSTSFQKNETDLVIIITPRLVKPAAPDQPLATPFDQSVEANDVDFFLMGKLEQKKKYFEYATHGGTVQGPYGHILSDQ